MTDEFFETEILEILYKSYFKEKKPTLKGRGVSLVD